LTVFSRREACCPYPPQHAGVVQREWGAKTMTIKSTYLWVALLGAAGFPLAAGAGAQAPSEALRAMAAKAEGAAAPAAVASQGPGEAAQGNPEVAPINAKITTVKSYADLGAEWWQWAVQAPAADSPLLDPDGAKCRVGQEGAVWFLATTLGSGVPTTRHCEVPGNKAIFFPVINAAYFAFLNDPPETRTAEAVRSAADASCDTSTISNLSVTIDGRPVARAARYVVSVEQSPLFQAQLPTDNIYGAVAVGDPNLELVIQDLVLSPAAHKGWYIYVKPLTPGNHTIEWTAAWECSWGPMSEDMRYELNVLSGVAGLVE
jgi:hypothetical protein